MPVSLGLYNYFLPFLLIIAGVTILLSLTVFHNIVTDTLPQVSDAMPILGTLSLLDPHLCHQIEPNFWRNTR